MSPYNRMGRCCRYLPAGIAPGVLAGAAVVVVAVDQNDSCSVQVQMCHYTWWLGQEVALDWGDTVMRPFRFSTSRLEISDGYADAVLCFVRDGD